MKQPKYAKNTYDDFSIKTGLQEHLKSLLEQKDWATLKWEEWHIAKALQRFQDMRFLFADEKWSPKINEIIQIHIDLLEWLDCHLMQKPDICNSISLKNNQDQEGSPLIQV